MSEENVPVEGLEQNSAGQEPENTGGKKAELWEFVCRTCNGKFITNIYEPRFCLHCGADLHFE